MQAIINGRPETGPFGTLLDLLKSRELLPDTVVLELNGQIVAVKDYAVVTLKDGDHLEIVQFVGGG